MLVKRLILCLDGTWNSTFQSEKRLDGSHIIKPSNVLKLARGVKETDDTNKDKRIPQVVYYDSGVGSLSTYGGASNFILSKVDNLLGGIFGAGLETNTEDALTFLVNNYMEGDEVYIFGFSRGAATARIVCNIIQWMGNKCLCKKDAYFLPHLIRGYLKYNGKKSVKSVLEEHETAPRNDEFKDIKILFLGLWDTVLAMKSLSKKDYQHLVSLTLPRSVDVAAHAISIDESRSDFVPCIWKTSADEQKLHQRWFAGVHSNVGGGYPKDGLANCALFWIIFLAEEHGLVFEKTFLKYYQPYHTARLYDSNRSVFRYLDIIRRKTGKRCISQATSKFDIDATAIFRMLSVQPSVVTKANFLDTKDYRPIYLLKAIIKKFANAQELYAYCEGQLKNEAERVWPNNYALDFTVQKVDALWNEAQVIISKNDGQT